MENTEWKMRNFSKGWKEATRQEVLEQKSNRKKAKKDKTKKYGKR